MGDSFPTTRSILSRLDNHLHGLVAPLLPPKRVPEPTGGFHFEFKEKSPYALMAAKAVRMVSGIRSAMALADQGYVTESASILRMVSDFHTEIVAVAEGLGRGEFTKAQREFLEQFFMPPPRTLEDHEQQEKQYRVARSELVKSHLRMAEQIGDDSNQLREVYKALDAGFNMYVHGDYLTAMELFDGLKGRFAVEGVHWEERLIVARRGVAGKLHEVLYAMQMIALAGKDTSLFDAINSDFDKLRASGEH